MRRFLRNDDALESVEGAILAALIVAGLLLIIATIAGLVARRWAQLKGRTLEGK